MLNIIEKSDFDDLARSLREALAKHVCDLQTAVAEERRKLEAAFDFSQRVTRDLEAFSAKVALACEELDSHSAQFAELESRVTHLAQLAEEVSALRGDFATLRADADSQMKDQQLFGTKLTSIETALQTQQESQPKMWEQLQQSVRRQQESQMEMAESQSLQLQTLAELVAQLRGRLAQLQEEQQLLVRKLDVQTEALRALHHAAQEQATQKKELRTLLEMIAGAPAEIKPLPEDI